MPHREAGPVCNKVDGKCIGKEWRFFLYLCLLYFTGRDCFFLSIDLAKYW